MVVGEGFEPSKSVTADLQSAPFGRSGIPPDKQVNTLCRFQLSPSRRVTPPLSIKRTLNAGSLYPLCVKAEEWWWEKDSNLRSL